MYRDIVTPGRLVFVNSFSDEQGNLTRHPLSPAWPLEILSTCTFAGQEDRAKFTVRWTPLNATEGERRTFDAGHESMRKGWLGTLDQLAEYLQKGAHV